MTALPWSPSDVLKLDPNSYDISCIGYAETQGRRCRNQISQANRQEAAEILLQMSRLDPQSPRLDWLVEDLTSCLLCRRYHQDQVIDMKEQWLGMIEEYLAAESIRQEQRLKPALTAATPAGHLVAPNQAGDPGRERSLPSVTFPLVPTSIVEGPVPAPVGEELARREIVERTVETNTQQTHSEPSSLTQQRILSQETTVNEPSNSLSSPREEPSNVGPILPLREPLRALNVESGEGEGQVHEQQAPPESLAASSAGTTEAEEQEEEEQAREQRQEDLREDFRELLATIGAETADAEQQRRQRQQRQQERARVQRQADLREDFRALLAIIGVETADAGGQGRAQRPDPPQPNRKAIEGDCSICCEDLVANNGHDITWCKARCGQNFHTDCVDEWHAFQHRDKTVKTCPYCRTGWSE